MSAGHSVPSPCVGVCRIDPVAGSCEGCLRTLDEIAAWPNLSNGKKLVVWRLLAERSLLAPPRKSTT